MEESGTSQTKERILQAALALFSRRGFGAVSVRDIAERLSISKGALYRHYKSKRDLFDCIVSRMVQADAERARAYAVPESAMADAPDAYAQVSLSALCAYGRAQFGYFTRDEFAAAFRRMLTLEQYADGEIATLYQQYFGSGPLAYTRDLLTGILGDASRAFEAAVAFYAPMHLLYALYDGAPDGAQIDAMLDRHFADFAARYGAIDDGAIETPRLRVLPLTEPLLARWLDDLPALEAALGVTCRAELIEGAFRAVVAGQLEAVRADPDHWRYHTFWLMIRKADGTVVGSADFKAPPTDSGDVEIGYGLGQDFTGCGYMTEAVRALCDWAFQQSGVLRIIAETLPENTASQHVLSRCGFTLYDERATLWWQRKKEF